MLNITVESAGTSLVITDLPELVLGDKHLGTLTLAGDARSGAAGYTPLLVIGWPGQAVPYAVATDYVAVDGTWTFNLDLATEELSDAFGKGLTVDAYMQVIISKDDLTENQTEALSPVRINRGSYNGALSPVPPYGDQFWDAAQSLADAISGIEAGNVDLTPVYDSIAEVASTSLVGDQSLATALDAETSRAVAVEALRVAKDASGNAEALNSLLLSIVPGAIPVAPGTLSWNVGDHTLDLQTDFPGVVYQLGQELGVVAKNLSGALIPNGTVVYVSGANGQRPTIEVADNTDHATAYSVIGLATADIAHGSDGAVTIFGAVREIDTSAFLEGDQVWLGTSGALTTTQPVHPLASILIGTVTYSHAVHGSISVRVQHVPGADDIAVNGGGTVQGALESIEAALSVAVSDRDYTDADLQQQIIDEVNYRVSADVSIVSALSAETSRAIVAETSLQSLIVEGGGGDMLSTNNLSDVADPVAARSNLGITLLQNPTITQVLSGGIAATLLSLTTAQLLALSSGDSASLRVAYCSDCYNLTGTKTGGLCFWDGSKWRLTCCSIEATTDELTLFRSCRDNSALAFNSKMFASARRTVGNRDISTTALNTNYYASTFSSEIDVSIIEGGTAGGYGSVSTFQDARRLDRCLGIYYSAKIARNSPTHSSAGDSFVIQAGMLGNTSYTGGGNTCSFLYDPQNNYGTGISSGNTNLHAVTGNGGVFTITDLGIGLEYITDTKVTHEVYGTPSSVKFYRNGSQVAEHTTNMPSSASLQANEVYNRITSSAGSNRGMSAHLRYHAELRA